MAFAHCAALSAGPSEASAVPAPSLRSLRRGQLRRVRALDQADLQGQRFKPAERAARLGELVNAMLQALMQALRAVHR